MTLPYPDINIEKCKSVLGVVSKAKLICILSSFIKYRDMALKQFAVESSQCHDTASLNGAKNELHWVMKTLSMEVELMVNDLCGADKEMESYEQMNQIQSQEVASFILSEPINAKRSMKDLTQIAVSTNLNRNRLYNLVKHRREQLKRFVENGGTKPKWLPQDVTEEGIMV